MIAYSIEAAFDSGIFQRVIVSTDDAEIAEVAQRLGADVPFVRPNGLADDHTVTVDVIAHAVEELKRLGCEAQYACCIYATAPFISSDDIRRGFDVISTRNFDYVFPATTFSYPIFRAIKQNDNGEVGMFFPEYVCTRSQDLPEALHDAGQFYWGHVQAWLGKMPILTGRSSVIKIPRTRVQDIDTHEDWHHAELLFRVTKEITNESA